MKIQADTEVAVLSGRADLDLAISTWLPGYVAHRTDDLDTVMDVARHGGVVLIDLGSSRHEEWVTALHDRGFQGPVVYLDPQGEVTIDLRERVVVPSPPSLSGLLAGFEEAQHTRQVPRRRSGGAGAGGATPARSRRRTSATPATAPRAAGPGAVGEGTAAGEGTATGEGTAAAEGAAVAGRARRLDRRQDTSAAAVPRARRSDRRHGLRATSRWWSRRGRSSAAVSTAAPSAASAGSSSASAVSSAAGAAGTGGIGGRARDDAGTAERGSGAAVYIDAEAERAFQAAFRAAETRPGVQRRIATPEGRIRVQTDEELFAGQPAPSPAVVERGTGVTPVPPRERRSVRTGA